MYWRKASFILLLNMVLISGLLAACQEKAEEAPTEARQETEHSLPAVPALSADESKRDPHSNEEADNGTVAASQIRASLELPLTAHVKTLDDGFQVLFADGEDAFVTQSMPTPRRDAVVHVIQRSVDSAAGGEYRKDLLLVRPEQQGVQSYEMMRGWSDDLYTTSSGSIVYGFLDEEHVIYMAVHGTADTPTSYSIDMINVYSGERTTLFADQPDNPSTDFFADGWLSADKRKLVVVTFDGGEVYVFDLQGKTRYTLEQKFPSQWPAFAISRSPDGERFWYQGNLYDLEGRMLAAWPQSDMGRYRLETRWSPDSQYAAQHYTNEDGPEHRITGGAYDVTAPQGIALLDRSGQILHRLETEGKLHLELVGWLPQQQAAVVQSYELDPGNKPMEQQRIKVEYKAVDIRSGQSRTLAAGELDSLSQVERVVAWYSYTEASDDMLFVDAEKALYWRPDGNVSFGSHLSGTETYWWGILDSDRDETAVYRLEAAERKIEPVFREQRLRGELMLNRWWITSDRAQGLLYRSVATPASPSLNP